MNLKEKNRENIDLMISEIKRKLKLVNEGMIRSESFSTEKYDELHEIYQLVVGKPSISVNEMEAILAELGSLREK